MAQQNQPAMPVKEPEKPAEPSNMSNLLNQALSGGSNGFQLPNATQPQ